MYNHNVKIDNSVEGACFVSKGVRLLRVSMLWVREAIDSKVKGKGGENIQYPMAEQVCCTCVIYRVTIRRNYKRLEGMVNPASPILNWSRLGASAMEAGRAFHKGMVRGKNEYLW